MNQHILIKTVDELIRCIKNNQATRFFIQLNCGGRSVKQIRYHAIREIFIVSNEIDDTCQKLTLRQLVNPQYSNIGLAIKKGALFAESRD